MGLAHITNLWRQLSIPVSRTWYGLLKRHIPESSAPRQLVGLAHFTIPLRQLFINNYLQRNLLRGLTPPIQTSILNHEGLRLAPCPGPRGVPDSGPDPVLAPGWEQTVQIHVPEHLKANICSFRARN